MPYVPSRRKTRVSGSLSGVSPTEIISSCSPSPCQASITASDETNTTNIPSQMQMKYPSSISVPSYSASPSVSASSSDTLQNSFTTQYTLPKNADNLRSELSSSPNSLTNIPTQHSSVLNISQLNFNYALSNHSLSDVGKSLSQYNIQDKDPKSNYDTSETESPIKNNNNSATSATKRKNVNTTSTEFEPNSTFFIPSPINEENLPLSLSFMKKPARSGSMDIDVDRIMKQNTLLNSKLIDSSSSWGVVEEAPSSPVSPLDSQFNISNAVEERRNSYSNPLVRKKSGELVKSSLKLNSAFQTSGAVSMPTTPTYKQVHFGTDIAVKYFDEKDKPMSISADNSPYGSDCEATGDNGAANVVDDNNDLGYYGFTSTTNNTGCLSLLHQRLYDSAKHVVENECVQNIERFKAEMRIWILDTSLLKPISYTDQLDCEVPVFLERCFINLEKTAIIGQIAVKNLSFFKKVVIKYTINDWRAIDRVNANYTSDIPRVLKKAGYDRFIFSIPTAQLLYKYYMANKFDSNPEVKFCIQYTTGGHDYWDNNHNKNYTLLFLHDSKVYVTETHMSSPTPRSAITLPDSYFKKGASISRDEKEFCRTDKQKPCQFMPTSTTFQLKRSKSFDKKKIDKTTPTFPSFLAEDQSLDSVDNLLLDKTDSALNTRGLKHNFTSNNTPNGNSVRIQNNELLKKLNEIKKGLPETKVNDANANTTAKIYSSIATEQKPNKNEIYPQFGTITGNGNKNKKESPENNEKKKGSSLETGHIENPGRYLFPTETTTENGVENESYKNLIEKYCFFNGPSTISSFMDDENEKKRNNFYDNKFY